MRGLGVIVNVIAVIVGSLLGLLMRKGVSKRFQDIAMQACGVSTIFIAISGAIKEMAKVSGKSLEMNGTMLMIISLIVGSLIGEAINIEKRVEHFGDWIKLKVAAVNNRKQQAIESSKESSKKSSKSNVSNDRFTEGFMTSTLIICVGAMAVVGSIQDGLTGDASMIYAKSVMDFIIVTILAATMGIGVMFSAFSVLVYQGLIT